MPYSRVRLTGQSVLIVDDSEQITALLRDIFSADGADVTVANSGQEAMVALQLRPYDLVLLDLLMPRPDGQDVIGFMQQLNPELLTRTIVLTADRYSRQVRRMEHQMHIRMTHKPFDVAELRTTARQVVGPRTAAA